MPTKTEQAFADQMEAEGYQVFQNGYPDFLCLKDGKGILVEVKRDSKEKLQEHQVKMLTELTTASHLKAFVWSPDNPTLTPFNKFPIIEPPRKLKTKAFKHIKYEATTKTQRNKALIEYINAHPDESQKEVGVIFNISKQRVRAILLRHQGHLAAH